MSRLKLFLFIILYLAVINALFGQVQWIESKWEDFRDGVEIDPAMYVSRRATFSDPDSGCVEFSARFDVNNDGLFDLCCVDRGGYLRLYLGCNPHDSIYFPINNEGGNCDLADLNLDGYAELIHSGYLTGNCYIYWGSSSGPSPYNPTLLPNNNGEAVYVVDIDKDGFLDIILSSESNNFIYIYWGSATGYNQTNFTRIDVGNKTAHNIEVADFDKDGWNDIALVHHYSNYISIVYWRRDREFREIKRVPFLSNDPHGLSVADLNKDGWLDLILTGYVNITSSYIYWGSDSGFSSFNRTIVNPGQCYGGSAIYDFNNDGWLDILYFRGTWNHTYKPKIYYNLTVSPYFSDSQSIEIGNLALFASGGFVADFNFDGNIDIFINNDVSNNYSYILLGPDFVNIISFPVNRDHHGVFREIGNIYDRSFTATYISSIFDVQQSATNGGVSWIPYEPPGSEVRIYVRGGNIVGSDTIWTDWELVTNNHQLPPWILRRRLYQYKAEFIYTKPCNLPWLERIQFIFNYTPGMYQIFSLLPESPLSKVMQGGIFHRYYKITDSLGNPISNASIVVDFDGRLYSFIANNEGIVDIYFGPMNQMPGVHITCRILSINSIPITPVEFEVEILERRYDRSYVFDGSFEVGASVGPGANLMLNKTKGLKLSGTWNEPDSLRISDRASVGYSLSPISGAIGVSISYDEKSLGAYAEGGVYAGGGLFEAGHFRFPYPVPHQNLEDAAALLLFLDPSGLVKGCQYIIPIIEWILGQSINDPLRNTREKGEVGIDIFGGAGGGFYVGNIIISGLPFGSLGYFSANGEVGASLHGIISYQKLHQENLNIINVEQYGVLQGGISADFVFNPLPNIQQQARAILDDWRAGFGGELHAGIGVFINPAMQIEKIKLYFIKKPSNSNQLEVNEFWFEAPNQQIMNEFVNSFSSNLLIGQVVGLISGIPSMIIAPIAFPMSCYQMFQKALEMQAMGRNLQVVYQKYIVDENILRSFSFRLGVIIPIDITLGIDYCVRNEKNLLVNYGKWLNGKFYKLYEYSDDPYTQIRNDVNNVPGELLTQVLTNNVIEDIFDWIIGVMPGEVADQQGLELEIGNCRLYVPIGALPAGESVGILKWQWAPETSEVKNILQKFRQAQQLQARLQYGIGGFYSLHPETTLALPAQLTLSYTDSEVVGINESLLAIYRWNDSLRKWIYIGGTVNLDSNFVRTNITRFGIHTIAPAVPSETIPLNPEPDSLPANGMDTVVVRGGPIYNNNGTLVPDGTLITVSTSAGTILTPDADTLIPGVQVLTAGGYIEFKIRAPNRAAISPVTAISVYGDAIGSAVVNFYDIIPPLAPIIHEAYAADSIMVKISWRRNNENDILGYKVYYDSDSLPPYQGHSPYDLPSPIDVGNDTTRILALPLHPDSNFYIRITAYDISRNESDYSEMIRISGMQVFDTIAPSIPELIAPRQNSAVNDSLPIFVWRRSSDNLTGVRYYLLHYYNNTGIDTTIMINDTFAIPITPLPDTTYFWQVKAFDWANNGSEWSEIWHFEIDTRGPTRPNLIYPQNDTCFNHLNIAFEWTPVTGLGKERKSLPINLPSQSSQKTTMEERIDMIKTNEKVKFNDLSSSKINEQTQITTATKVLDASEVRYILEIDTSQLFENPIYIETTAITYDTVNLFESRFYWRVRAYDLAGNQGEFSDTFNFIADTTKPSVPILIYPLNGAPVTDTFIWHRAMDNLSGIKGYRIQIAYDSLFNNLMLDSILNTPNDTILVFHPDSAGYWRVKSIDRALNESYWSEKRSFVGIVEAENKTILLPSVFILFANQPNPFAHMTEIRYGLPIKTRLRIAVYNSLGEEIATLLNGIQNPGWYSVKWNGKDNKGKKCPAGIYFYRLECEEYEAMKKMVKIR